MKTKTLVSSIILFSAAVSISLRAQPSIRFDALDLADTTIGLDLWRYSYDVSGFTFQAGQGFSVFFDPDLYTNLHNPQPDPSALWSSIVVQPDLILHVPGFFDAQALVNSPSLVSTFQVDFIWHGAGIPLPQSFSIYDVDYSTLAGGATDVPEPQSTDVLKAWRFVPLDAKVSVFKNASYV